MSQFEFDDIDQEYAEARRGLHDALENIDNLEFAVGEGPLTLDQAGLERIVDHDFQEVMARFGWPSRFEDSIIEPVHDFSSIDFLESMRPEDTRYGGHRKVNTDHFFIMLSQQPITSHEEATTGNSYYGRYPVLHRAHVLAPDLFSNLQTSLAKIVERYGNTNDNEDRVHEALQGPHNEEIVEGLHMAYQIMGRLLKVDDFRFFSSEPAPILNADVALRKGR